MLERGDQRLDRGDVSQLPERPDSQGLHVLIVVSKQLDQRPDGRRSDLHERLADAVVVGGSSPGTTPYARDQDWDTSDDAARIVQPDEGQGGCLADVRLAIGREDGGKGSGGPGVPDLA